RVASHRGVPWGRRIPTRRLPARSSLRLRESSCQSCVPPSESWCGKLPGRRGLRGGLAAVDVDRGAHDVRGFVGCQEDVGGSELGGLAGTAEPGVFAEVREFLRELAVRGL